MKSLHKTYTIKVPKSRVWVALTDPKYIEAWGAGPAKMSIRKGAKFSLWGGDIYGTNRDVVPDEKIVQEWFGGPWNAPSILTIVLTESKGRTKVTLTQTDIPDEEAANIDDGWSSYYFGPLKKYLESHDH